MASKPLRACIIVCLAYGCVYSISRALGHDCKIARAKEELSLSIPQAARSAANSEVHVLASKSTLSGFSNIACAFSAPPSDGKAFPAKVLDTPFHIVVYHADSINDLVSNQIKSDGAWEKQATERLMKLMPCSGASCSQKVFVDIGANIGWFSLTALHLGYTVVAFEPFKRNVELLCESLKTVRPHLLGRFRLYNLGLDFTTRHCELFQVAKVNIGDTHSVCDEAMRASILKGGYESLGWMNTTTLDAAVKNGLFDLINHIDVMKMDVEGFEHAVIDGGNSFFTSQLAPRFLYIELVSAMMGNAGGLKERGSYRLDSVLLKLASYGYEFARNDLGNAKISLQISPLEQVRNFVDGKTVLFARQ